MERISYNRLLHKIWNVLILVLDKLFFMQIFKKFILAIVALSFVLSSSANAASILRDEEIERMLKKMSTPIFEQANIPPRSVNFILLNDDKLNAFVAGGQNIFINSGLILETDNVEELLGVIAHETGHIASGHLVRINTAGKGLSFQAMLSTILGVAVAVGTGSAEAGMAISRLGTDAAYKKMLKHTRTQEGSADQASIKFLKNSDMPISGLLSFLKKLEDQELLPASQQSKYLRTHPLTQDRIHTIEHANEQWKKGSVSEEWKRNHKIIKAKTLGYLFPDEQLTIRGNDFATKYGHAVAYYKKNNFKKALPIIDELIQQDSDNAYLYEFKGQIFYNKGDIEDSINAYKKAVELVPDSGLIKIGYAYSLLAAQSDKHTREDEAIKILNRAILIEKNSSEPHHLLAIAYGRRGLEGMSSLHLSEEAIMENNPKLASISAMRAMTKLKKDSPAYYRAKLLLEKAQKAYKESKK